MKKNPLLNSDISRIVSQLGHTDLITISDSGFPIPCGVERIDLALTKGIPTFIQTLEAVLLELCIEKVYIAQEMKEKSPEIYKSVVKTIENVNNNFIEIIEVSHSSFKIMSKDTKAVIRSGEATPFANIILQAGVVF